MHTKLATLTTHRNTSSGHSPPNFFAMTSWPFSYSCTSGRHRACAEAFLTTHHGSQWGEVTTSLFGGESIDELQILRDLISFWRLNGIDQVSGSSPAAHSVEIALPLDCLVFTIFILFSLVPWSLSALFIRCACMTCRNESAKATTPTAPPFPLLTPPPPPPPPAPHPPPPAQPHSPPRF